MFSTLFSNPFSPCSAAQYAYNKHIHLRDGLLEQPLLAGEEGGRGSVGGGSGEVETGVQTAAGQQAARPSGQQQAGRQQQGGRDYHYLLSKLWWAGVFLILLALGLLSLTIYTLIAPPV